MGKNEQVVTEEMEVTTEKKVEKKSPKKDKKPNIFVRFGKKMKEVFGELKKVSWPSFGKVVKSTGIVVAVVVLFLVLITAIDFGLANLLELLVIS